MFFAKETNNREFSLFLSFLEDYLKGDESEKGTFEEIIKEAQALLRKEKTAYKINREILPIVLFLVLNFPEHIKTMDTKNLTKRNFEELHKYLASAI